MELIDKYPFDKETREFVKAGKASPKWRKAISIRLQLVWQFTLLICIVTIPLMPIAAIIIYFWSNAYVNKYSFEFQKERIVVKRGVMSKRTVNIPYDRIQNVVISQSFIDRIVGVYNINIETAGGAVRQGAMAFGADASIQGVENPEPIKDFIHWMVKKAQEDSLDDGVSFTSAKTRRDKTDLATLRELQAISASLHSIEAILRAQNPKLSEKKIQKHKVVSVQCPYCAHTFVSKVGETVECPHCGVKGDVDY